jgi:hypothetical protein
MNIIENISKHILELWKSLYLDNLEVFKSTVMIVFQSIFYSKIYQNNIYFLKNYI